MNYNYEPAFRKLARCKAVHNLTRLENNPNWVQFDYSFKNERHKVVLDLSNEKPMMGYNMKIVLVWTFKLNGKSYALDAEHEMLRDLTPPSQDLKKCLPIEELCKLLDQYKVRVGTRRFDFGD